VFSCRIAGVPVTLLKPAESTGSGLFRGGRIYGGSYNETEAYLYFCRWAGAWGRRSLAGGGSAEARVGG
jgi:hypothetical protein